MIRPAAIAAGLSVVLTLAAGAQDTSSLLPSDPDASAELAKIIAATRDAGLPVDPIFAKINFGVRVSHAPPGRIVAAARALASRLGVARDALAPAIAADIVAGADALQYGATRDALRAVRVAGPSQALAIPLAVLAQLVSSRVPSNRAAEIVTDLMKRGASAQQLVALGNDVNDDVTRGAQALAALDTRMRGLNAVLAPAGAAATAADAAALSGPKKP